MLAGPLRLLSAVCCVIALLSFAAFAADQARDGSRQSEAEITRQSYVATTDPAGWAKPPPSAERLREQEHGSLRELVDDADDLVVAPFAAFTDGSSSAWTRRTVPFLLALAVYGFGLGYLSRYAAGRA